GAATQAPAAILVLPFRVEGAPRDVETYGWIAQAVRQELLNEAVSVSALRPAAIAAETAKPQAAPDPPMLIATAAAAGRDAGAAVVVFGNVQIVDGELRLTGHVVDAAQAQPLGALKATGKLPDLFRLEDELSAQLKRIIVEDGRFAAAEAADDAAQPAPPGVTYVPPPAPQPMWIESYVPPASSYYDRSYYYYPSTVYRSYPRYYYVRPFHHHHGTHSFGHHSFSHHKFGHHGSIHHRPFHHGSSHHGFGHHGSTHHGSIHHRSTHHGFRHHGSGHHGSMHRGSSHHGSHHRGHR
ncbi:MAG: hypothetical protein WBD40_16855, partial [Tepidisphaeraceae bacterium]